MSFYLSKKKKKELNFLCRSLKGFSEKITIKCIRHNIYEWEFTNGDAPLDKDH